MESALLRAQTAAYYQQADMIEEAAFIIAGIAYAHAFLDGNKRTATVAGGAFLDSNGWHIPTTGDLLGRQVVALVQHTGSQETATQQFLVWLRTVVVQSP